MFDKRDRYPGRVRWFHDSPCEGVTDAFYQELRRLGYINNRVRILVRAAQHFAHLASRRNVPTADFDENLLQSFMVHLKRCRCSRYSARQRSSQEKGVRLFLQHLRDTAVISRPAAEPANKEPMTPIAPHITAFFEHRLPIERGVSDNTRDSYAYTSGCC